MKRGISILGVLALSVASAAGQTTTTKQTTVQTSPDGTTKVVQYTGEIVRYEPGKTIVLRHPDSRVVTYTIGPSATVPAEVQVGRRVMLSTEPAASGTTVVTRITTVSTSAAPVSGPQTTVSSSRETVVKSPGGAQTTTTTTRTTSVTGEVVRIEPGRSIALRGPDSKVVTYTLGPALTVPAEIQMGRKVIVYTEPTDSGVLVTRITTVSPDGAAVTKETVTTAEGAQVTTTSATTVAGEVVRYEPGQTIVLRHPDSQEVTYTLSPSLEAPAEVTLGRRVTVTTQPSSSGPVMVTRITTETTSGGTTTETVTEKTMDAASGGTQFTTVYGTVTAYDPGKTVTVVLPNKRPTTYVIDTTSDLPTDLAIGKTVTIRTTTLAGSKRPVVRKVTYKTSTQTKKQKSVS